MLVKPVQPENVQKSIVVMLLGIVMLVNLLRLLNAPKSIKATLLGMVTLPLMASGTVKSWVFALSYNIPSWLA